MSALFNSDFFFLHQVMKAASAAAVMTVAALMETLMRSLAPVLQLLLREHLLQQQLLQNKKDRG